MKAYLSLVAMGLLATMFVPAANAQEKTQACKDREMREHMSEKQIDNMLRDSFPASDPSSTY